MVNVYEPITVQTVRLRMGDHRKIMKCKALRSKWPDSLEVVSKHFPTETE
jgi:hypothetical protein